MFEDYAPFIVIMKYWLYSLCCTIHPRGSLILLTVVQQQLVVIMVFPWEGVGTCPSTPPSCLHPMVIYFMHSSLWPYLIPPSLPLPIGNHWFVPMGLGWTLFFRHELEVVSAQVTWLSHPGLHTDSCFGLQPSLAAPTPALPMVQNFFLFSSVVSNSLRPHGLQHARPPCLSPTGVHPNPCPWCHPTISSCVVPFSSHLQSFPA